MDANRTLTLELNPGHRCVEPPLDTPIERLLIYAGTGTITLYVACPFHRWFSAVASIPSRIDDKRNWSIGYPYFIMILPRRDEIPGENRTPHILGGIIFPQILTLAFLLGRILARARLLKIWSWDDTLITLAWLNSLSLTILFGIATIYGQGHHLDDVPLPLLRTSFSITYITLITYQLALCLTKFSILVFYLRVFPGRRERWLTWGTIIFVAMFGVPIMVGDIFQCDPIDGKSFLAPDMVCTNPTAWLLASTILHTITDAWLIIMVIPVICSLQIPPRQKYALMIVLSLGIFVIIASIARIVKVLGKDRGAIDITWAIADFDIWSVIECCIGIICACAPTIRPLLVHLFPKFMSSQIASGRHIARTESMEGVSKGY